MVSYEKHPKTDFENFEILVCPIFSGLEVISQHFGPQIRIQHPKIPLWTSSEVSTNEFYVKNVKNIFVKKLQF